MTTVIPVFPPFTGLLIIVPTGLAFAVLAYLFLVHPLLRGPLSHVPGPWMNKISGLYLAYYELRYSRNAKILKWHERYGPVVCISPNSVSVATLDATRTVYRAARGWAKSDYFDSFTYYHERPVFSTKSYEAHRDQRKSIASFYQASNIYRRPELEQHIRDRCEAVLRHPARASVVDVYRLTDWYALDVITYLTFGHGQGTRCVDGPCPERVIVGDLQSMQFAGPLRALFPGVFARLTPLLTQLKPSLGYLAAEEALAAWCQGRMADAEKNVPPLPKALSSSSSPGPGPVPQPQSLFQRLREFRHDAAAPPLGRQVVAAEMLDNINAARATVAVTATYLIWLLSRHPRWQGAVRQELSALAAARGVDDGPPAFADVDSQAPALEACLRETYRLYPASSGRAERLVPRGGCELSGVPLPEGCVVASSVLALHQDGRLFPRPDVFAPERWLGPDDDMMKARKAQLIPFGYGGRICLGIALATMEIKLLVAAIYLRYETAPAIGCDLDFMRQSSTHDAVPWEISCPIEFRRLPGIAN